MIDPFEHLRDADENYRGLFVALISDHHRVVRMRRIYDGGMVEFFDPQTGACVGCCGMLAVDQFVDTVEDFVRKYG